MRSNWREYSNKIIKEAYAQLLVEMPDATPEQRLKKISREEYPFGERAMHPYKIWLSAIRRFTEQQTGVFRRRNPRAADYDPRQLNLFGE